MALRLRDYLASSILVGFAFTAAISEPARAQAQKPNILVIMGDDIGQTNISAYSFGLVGYKTPNIDRIAREGTMFTDYYAITAAPLAARRSLRGRRRSAPAYRKSAFPARQSGFRPVM